MMRWITTWCILTAAVCWVGGARSLALAAQTPGEGMAAPVRVDVASQRLQEAQSRLQAREYSAAERICKEVVAAYPQAYYDARVLLCDIYASQGRYEEAKQQADLALRYIMQWASGDRDRIREAQALGRRIAHRAEAEAQFVADANDLQQRAMAATDPNDAAALRLELGDLLVMKDRRDQGIAQYRQIIDSHPGTKAATQAAKRLAALYEMAGEEEKAHAAYVQAAGLREAAAFETDAAGKIAEYQKVANEHPGSPEAMEALYQIACLETTHGKYAEAVARLAKLVAEAPGTPVAARATNWLMMLSETQGTEVPAALIQRAVAGGQDEFETMGRRLIEGYEKTMAADPQNAAGIEAQYEIACVYASYHRYAEAIEQYTRLIETQPATDEAVKALDMLQATCVAANMLAPAPAAILAALEQHHGDEPATMLTICRLHAEAGRGDEATRVAEALAVSQPTSAEASWALLAVWERQFHGGRGDAAKATRSRLRNDMAEGWVVLNGAATEWYSRGLMLANAGQHEDALRSLVEAEAIEPDAEIVARIKYQKAMCYHALKQDSRAIEEFERVVAAHPSSILGVRSRWWAENLKNQTATP